MTIEELFEEFQRIPEGVLIEMPDAYVATGLSFHDKEVIFTRRSLKHVAEKGRAGLSLLGSLSNVITDPDQILKMKNRNARIALVKFFPYSGKEPHVVVLESISKYYVIITIFVANKKYLKNFEILWRTDTSPEGEAVPPSAYLP